MVKTRIGNLKEYFKAIYIPLLGRLWTAYIFPSCNEKTCFFPDLARSWNTYVSQKGTSFSQVIGPCVNVIFHIIFTLIT